MEILRHEKNIEIPHSSQIQHPGEGFAGRKQITDDKSSFHSVDFFI